MRFRKVFLDTFLRDQMRSGKPAIGALKGTAETDVLTEKMRTDTCILQ